MADWQQGFYFTMRFEAPGLLGTVTFDSGGTTRYGISERAHPEVYPQMEECDDATAIQIAKTVYRENYWCGDNLISQDVANKISDLRYNMGVKSGTKIAQRAAGTTVDGFWGAQTELAVNRVEEQLMLSTLRNLASQHYQEIAAANPSEAKYLNGWVKRAAA